MFDAYSRRARLAPVALASLPAIVLFGSGVVDPKHAASVLAMALGALGVVICGFVRGAGRRLQPQLWESWGGSPTIRRLRWLDAPDRASVQRLHERIERATGEAVPTQSEEEAAPAAADRRYDEITAALRQLTRSRKDFPLVFEENTEYGFRRNCLGIRPVATAIATATLIASIVLISIGDHATRFWIAGGAGIVALIAWTLLVRPAWVQSAAELYAERLFEAAFSLAPTTTGA